MEDENMEVVDAPQLEKSLKISEIVRSSQLEHGLRHGDFLRYRRYCTKRLRRVRTNKDVRFLHGANKGRIFVKKQVTVSDVKDVKVLLIPLINAERAWS